ncbi:putative tigger transposable element-derived protein 1-like [Ditylenchus destructor]|uniref:Tigger transposable element-derived protein 1-like n=1 Tax=Ditylenchus destructor TaxID=166010 RepID=A0AAD4MNZ2_9BILA|nr:putative tigger transposable element-derived protein 1-like [Ditylenchus destructor]
MKNEPRYRRESLKVHGGEKKNLPGQGRHLVNSGFDGELASWIRQERALKGCCTQSVMLARAKVLAQRYDVGINLSHDWFQAFVGRHNFSLRKTTRVAQKPPEDYVRKIVDFILYARILAMDEMNLKDHPHTSGGNPRTWTCICAGFLKLGMCFLTKRLRNPSRTAALQPQTMAQKTKKLHVSDQQAQPRWDSTYCEKLARSPTSN